MVSLPLRLSPINSQEILRFYCQGEASHCLCGCLRLIRSLLRRRGALFVSLPLRLSPINSSTSRLRSPGSCLTAFAAVSD